MFQFSMWIILSWRKSRHWGLMRSVYFALKECKLEALPIRVITRDNFLRPIYRAEQTSNCWTVHSYHPATTFLPSEAPRHLSSSLAQSVTCTSLHLSVSKPLVWVESLTLLYMWDSHAHTHRGGPQYMRHSLFLYYYLPIVTLFTITLLLLTYFYPHLYIKFGYFLLLIHLL